MNADASSPRTQCRHRIRRVTIALRCDQLAGTSSVPVCTVDSRHLPDMNDARTPQRPRQRLSSSALVITLTELIAIAAPASTGFRYPNAASGMPAAL